MPTPTEDDSEDILQESNSLVPAKLIPDNTGNILQRLFPGWSVTLSYFASSDPSESATAPASPSSSPSPPPPPHHRRAPPALLLDWCWRRVTCSAPSPCALSTCTYNNTTTGSSGSNQQQPSCSSHSHHQVLDTRPLCMVVDAEPSRASGAWARWRRLFSSSSSSSSGSSGGSSSRRMSSVPSDDRTGTELSRCMAGVRAGPMPTHAPPTPPPRGAARGGGLIPETNGHHHRHHHHHHHGVVGGGRTTVRVRSNVTSHLTSRPCTLSELWRDERFLEGFFLYFTVTERRALAQVCARWRDVLYQPRFWLGMAPLLRCRELRGKTALRKRLYGSMQRRGFDSLCLVGANDDDVYDLINNYPPCAKHVRRVSLRCCAVTDKGVELLLEHMQCVCQLEITGCNEITETGLWTCLTPRLVSLSIADCINVADESVGAVAQLLPSLYELNLQAYHVTDAALGYFSAKQAASLSILRLQSCWEITNHGLVNIVHALPNLTVLSLSGCSKITDDGVELVAENLRHLRTLDLSWCPRITDVAVEYIACDLTQLEELTLDRCVHITDIGVGYISTMLSLTSLFLRWCTQIRDFGLQHLCSMRSIQVLSLAGCSLLTSSGLSSLVRLRHLQELELTNCPGASRELFDYLHEHLPKCLIVE